jgi:hypothetical protein
MINSRKTIEYGSATIAIHDRLYFKSFNEEFNQEVPATVLGNMKNVIEAAKGSPNKYFLTIPANVIIFK